MQHFGSYKFRVGAAGLRAGLHSGTHEIRYCSLCTMSAVEDDRHFLQVCTAYTNIHRDPAFQELFGVLEQNSVKDFLNVEDQHRVALCVSRMLRLRRDLLPLV